MKLLHPGIIESKALRDENFMALYSQENEIKPEDVLDTIYKEMDSAELKPQKPQGKAPPDEDSGKSKTQILDDVISTFTGDKGANPQSGDHADSPASVINDVPASEPAAATMPPDSPDNVEKSNTLNPIAQAMQAKSVKAESDTEEDDESDFNQMYAEDPHFHQLIEDFNQRHEQNGAARNDTTTKNIEKSINQPDIGGGF